MRTAIIVPFHHYDGVRKSSMKKLFNFWIYQLKKSPVAYDAIYVIDSGKVGYEVDNFPTPVHILPSTDGSHWGNLQERLFSVPEDKVLLVDSDTIIFNPDGLLDVIDALNDYPIVAAFDGSGGVPLENKYAWAEENDYRDAVRRFAPYFFAFKRDFLQQFSDVPLAPIHSADYWYDSFGLLSDKISIQTTLEGKKIGEEFDDRWSVYVDDDDLVRTNHFSRTENKDFYHWHGDIFYHIRNIGMGMRIRDSFFDDTQKFYEYIQITPRREALRLLAWTEIIGVQVPYSLLDELKVSRELWQEYLEAFSELHSWLKE